MGSLSERAQARAILEPLTKVGSHLSSRIGNPNALTPLHSVGVSTLTKRCQRRSDYAFLDPGKGSEVDRRTDLSCWIRKVTQIGEGCGSDLRPSMLMTKHALASAARLLRGDAEEGRLNFGPYLYAT